ncbi:MAG: hypothetical protein V3T17_01390 [Pseudomonadales bacterium]
MFEYKIENILSTISFDYYQVIVVELSDKQGDIFKGIGVGPAPSIGQDYLQTNTNDYYQPLIIEPDQALLLCNYIEEILAGALPNKITINTSGPKLTLNLKKFTEKWHGGGGYIGSVTFGKFGFLNILSNFNVTIAKNSLTSLRKTLIGLYELENMAVINA